MASAEPDQQTQPDPRRAELVRIAREVFAEQGFEATGIRDIAARMGILGGSLYHYIDSKQALLAEVMKAFHAPIAPLATATAEDPRPVRERFVALMRSHVEHVAADPLGMQLAFTAVDHLPDDARAAMRDEMREYRRSVEDLVRAGQASGDLRAELDPALAAMAILGAVNWTSRWLSPTGAQTPAQIGEALAGLLLDGAALPGVAAGPVPPVDASPGGAGTERERAVWAAAARLYRTRGFAGTSMAELAREVGLGKASLYHYVTTKEQLLFDVMRHAQEPSTMALEALAADDAPAVDRLRAALAFNVRYLADHLDPTSLVLHSRRDLTPEHRAEVDALAGRYVGALRTILRDGREAGELRTTPELGVALNGLLGAVNWPYRWYRPRGAGDAVRVADGIADVLVGGLAVRS